MTLARLTEWVAACTMGQIQTDARDAAAAAAAAAERRLNSERDASSLCPKSKVGERATNQPLGQQPGGP
jgi:hypothetical protein